MVLRYKYKSDGESKKGRLTAANSYVLTFHVDKACEMYRFHAPNLVKEVDIHSISGISTSSIDPNSMTTSATFKVVEVKIEITREIKAYLISSRYNDNFFF